MRLYGKNFVAFRATDGRIGFFDEECPHRCVSLALARNEGNGLRCLFHGWKIDVSGKLVDAPSEPSERQEAFCANITVNHYPAREAGGLIWVYLGKRAAPPPFFDFELARLPESHVDIRRAVLRCNWLQGLEGTLDTVHAGILHVGWIGDPARRWQGTQGAELHVLSRKVPSAAIEFEPRALRLPRRRPAADARRQRLCPHPRRGAAVLFLYPDAGRDRVLRHHRRADRRRDPHAMVHHL